MMAQIAEAVKSLATQSLPLPDESFSRFSSLAQGLQGVQPVASILPPTAFPPPLSSDVSGLADTVRSLQSQVKDLSTKLSSILLDSGNHCVRFGNTGFRSPREVLPLIWSQMSTSYFGCFVNAVILLEWIIGNSGEDTLKNMERMHTLKISLLAEVHDLKGLESSLPPLFGDLITFMGRQHTSYFTKVPNAGVWTNGSTETKEFILTNLSMVVEAVRATFGQ
jgi:hypothetical protein